VQAVGAGGGASQPIGDLPAARADHVAAVVNNTAYVLGGGQEAVRLVPQVVATTDGTTWRSAGTLAAPVRYPAVAVVGGSIYLFGGVQSTGMPDSSAIQRYDPASGTTTVVGQLPTPLSHATAVVLHGAVFLLGGFANNVITAQALRVDLPAATVTGVGTLPAAVSDAAAVSINDNALLVGGQGASSAPVDTIVALSLGR
jgi:N-acetylneuraminic acid mutarotase